MAIVNLIHVNTNLSTDCVVQIFIWSCWVSRKFCLCFHFDIFYHIIHILMKFCISNNFEYVEINRNMCRWHFSAPCQSVPPGAWRKNSMTSVTNSIFSESSGYFSRYDLSTVIGLFFFGKKCFRYEFIASVLKHLTLLTLSEFIHRVKFFPQMCVQTFFDWRPRYRILHASFCFPFWKQSHELIEVMK